MLCFNVLLRILVIISFLALLTAERSFSQIACPAMGLTQVNVNKKDKLAGFSKAVRKGKKKTQMGNFFTVKKKGKSNFSSKDPFAFRSKKSGKVKEYSEFNRKSSRRSLFRDYDEFASKKRGRGSYFDKDEFASRSKKKGRFRSYDEFATRSKRSKRFKDFDEFAYRSSKRSRFNDKDEFATKRKHNKRINIDSQFSVKSTERRFNSSKKQKSEFRSKKKRTKEAKTEYSPFASTTSPNAGQRKHRQPQIGLWGGTIGKRSGKDKRAMIPLPEPSKKGRLALLLRLTHHDFEHGYFLLFQNSPFTTWNVFLGKVGVKHSVQFFHLVVEVLKHPSNKCIST